MRSERLLEYTLKSDMKYTVAEAQKLLYVMINPEEITKDSDYHKHLFFEMHPLLYLGEYLPDVKWIKFSGDLQRYDGEVKFRNNPDRQKIEFVRAVDSEEEAMLSQMQKIKETLPDFDLEPEPEILDNKMLFKELKKMKWLWRKAFRLKLNKNKKTKQYKGVWLGIVFDDSNILSVAHKKLDKRIKKICMKNARVIRFTFGRVFFIGLSGKYIFDSASVTK